VSHVEDFSAALAERLLAGHCSGRVIYVYGPMGSGKSQAAIDLLLRLHQSGRGVLALVGGTKPRTAIDSRSGRRWPSHPVRRIVDQPGFLAMEDIILTVDEAQFLTNGEVVLINGLVSQSQFQVVCFGLLWDSEGELFQGAKSLLDAGAEALELPHELKCWCGGHSVADVLCAEEPTTYISACFEHKGLPR
jgi:thymidine kinase